MHTPLVIMVQCQHQELEHSREDAMQKLAHRNAFSHDTAPLQPCEMVLIEHALAITNTDMSEDA